MVRWSALFTVLVLIGVTLASAPSAPASHDAVVPVMDLLAQNTVEGIRPGAWMEEPAACTFAFVVEDENGKLYITTAGHCVNHVGQAVTIREEGEIGTVVAFEDAGAPRDYALIRIHEDKYDRVDPTMIGWGGPTGLYTDSPAGLQGIQTLKHYGWGTATWMDHTTRCRQAVANGGSWDSTTFSMFGTVLFGDSGSGTITADGLALGINTHIQTVATQGISKGPRFDHALDRLSTLSGLGLSLVEGGPVNEVCDAEN